MLDKGRTKGKLPPISKALGRLSGCRICALKILYKNPPALATSCNLRCPVIRRTQQAGFSGPCGARILTSTCLVPRRMGKAPGHGIHVRMIESAACAGPITYENYCATAVPLGARVRRSRSPRRFSVVPTILLGLQLTTIDGRGKHAAVSEQSVGGKRGCYMHTQQSFRPHTNKASAPAWDVTAYATSAFLLYIIHQIQQCGDSDGSCNLTVAAHKANAKPILHCMKATPAYQTQSLKA